MQLSEVKNDIAKIIYNPAENHLLPADFLHIKDLNQKLIAQVINISTTNDANNNIADIRLALSIDKDDNLSYYNGHIPSKSSEIKYINPDEIVELIKGSGETIYFGNLSNHSDCFVKQSLSFIDDKVYIQSDRDDKTKTIIQNLVAELYQQKKKVVLLDFDGRYNSIYNVPRLKVSDSFKLPLNVEAFNTILEYDIVDCPIEDKAVIQSIVLELREYINTLENKFLPFTLFRNVVDNEFMANPISGLMLLRNKLWLYAQESIFAESKSQFDLINNILDKQDVLVIDASNLEEKWYKFIIQTLVSLIGKNCYLVLSLNDVPMDKKSIISLYNTQNIIPIVSTSYDSKYRQLLKSVCKNQILFKPSYLINDEDAYNSLLQKINSGEYILYGESTLYLPLVLELQSFDSSTKEEVIQNEIKKDVDKFLSSPKKILPAEATLVDEVQNDESVVVSPVSDDVDTLLDDFSDADLDFLEEQDNQKESITVEDIRKPKKVEPVDENQYDIFVPMSVRESMARTAKKDQSSNVEPKSVDSQPLPEEKENDIEEILNDTQLEELSSIEEDNSTSIDSLINDVSVDSVDEIQEQNSDALASIDDVISDITTDVEEEKLSPDALLIDAPNNEVNEEQEKKEEDFEIELETDDDVPPPVNENINTKSSSKLPIYESGTSAEEIGGIPFKIGDRVFHPKHGKGVIEGFANYSNKILFCQIEFDNVGRRILDPRIAGIEKIS